MKTNCWLILGIMLATTAGAQVNTNKLPAIPAPAIATPAAPAALATTPSPVVTATDSKTNAPAKKAVKAKKKAPKKAKVAPKTADQASDKAAVKEAGKKEMEKKGLDLPVTLVPGAATVAKENVNLRGQAGLQGEVVGHVRKGDTVTVLAEINLDKPKAGEPAQWAKITLPSSTKVWVDAKYVDATNKVVSAKKLNLRGGPGENFSVVGVIEKGAAVTTVSTKGNWMEIQAPANAFAFVAASYLKQEGSGTEISAPAPVPPTPVVAATEPLPPPPAQATIVAETPQIATPAAVPQTPPVPETPVAVLPPAPTPAPDMVLAPAPLPTVVLPPEADDDDDNTNLPPPPPRIITHEGLVRHSVSPVAPTYYELFDPQNDKAINYLYTPTTNLNVSLYNGKHITVKGQEGMDVRWKDTPVLTIQEIHVLADDKPVVAPKTSSSSRASSPSSSPKMKPVRSPLP
jgi:uncharacterized protein YgiM (DUF1202 family)